ncbi:MAG: DUF4307 domain-containing protein [Kitasatospora sp.]|jgi:hypothetical protein|nr:DUF4307 domain-containing protein [Kitasatospora sp.]
MTQDASTVRQEPPAGRYGRQPADDARADRRLKAVGAVLAVVAVGVIGWFGYHSIAGTDVSGELIAFKVVSGTEAEAHIEVRKDTSVTGVCTLRALSTDKAEVARRDVRLAQHSDRIATTVTLRTTARATAVELVACKPAGN